MIRRRRECVACERRFTSYEKIERLPFHVIKRDERREPYDREKLMRGLLVACRKRPIPAARLDRLADEIEQSMHEAADREIASHELGNMIMAGLRQLDSVAYVRFASVYRRFEDAEEFVRELHQLKEPPNK